MTGAMPARQCARQQPASSRPGWRRSWTSSEDGETPNSGRFCSFCYNPLPPGFERCDHCGQDLRERPPVHLAAGRRDRDVPAQADAARA